MRAWRLVLVGLLAACERSPGCEFAWSDRPPNIAIATPDGSAVGEGEALELVATVADADGLEDVREVVWTSDLSGELGWSTLEDGGATVLEVVLEAGAHAITVEVVDFGDHVDQDEVTVYVVEAAR